MKSGTALLKQVVENPTFVKLLCSTEADHLGNFLMYLAVEQDERVLAQELVDQIFEKGMQNVFDDLGKTALAGFANAVREASLYVKPDIWQALIMKICGSNYSPVAPHPDYDQERLISEGVDALVQLLESFVSSRRRYEMNCIVATLASDENRLRTWMERLSRKEAQMLMDAALKLHFKPPASSWETLTAIASGEATL
jgi:hypothetical protein